MAAQKKKIALRVFWYLLGLAILAVGITVNSKTTLGVSPIISVSFCASQLWGWNFGNATFVWYGIFALAEMVLHLIQRGPKLKRQLTSDALQLVVSLLFTRFMNLFSAMVPVFEMTYPGTFWGGVPGRFLILLLAITLTGVGAAMSLEMRIVPNPGDGLVQTIADFTGLSAGTSKNLVDLCCVLLTMGMGLLFAGRIVGIGLGTVAAVLGVGRVMALFESLFGEKLRALL